MDPYSNECFVSSLRIVAREQLARKFTDRVNPAEAVSRRAKVIVCTLMIASTIWTILAVLTSKLRLSHLIILATSMIHVRFDVRTMAPLIGVMTQSAELMAIHFHELCPNRIEGHT